MEQTQSERRYWKHPVELKKTNHLRVLNSVPISEANLQNLDEALDALVADIGPALKRICSEMKGIKVWPSLHVRYESANPLDTISKSVEAHLGVAGRIFEHEQTTLEGARSMYAGQINQFAAGIRNSNAKFIRDKSGLMLAEVYSITFKISRFNPLEGSGYQKLPKFQANKNAIVNVQNNDERCFGYSVLAALLPNRNAYRPAHYSEADFAEHGLDAIEYPVSPTDLPRIEQQLNISINVIGFYDSDGKERYPLYCSRHVSETEIDLLYWVGHFAWIKDFSRLMRDITNHGHRYFWCKRCFGHFQEENTLARQKQLCTRENFISNVHILPEPGSSIKFTNWKYITMAPFVIYADLESVLADVDISHSKTCLYQKHKCFAASAIIRSEKCAEMDGKFCLFTGENALKQILDQLVEWETRYIEIL